MNLPNFPKNKNHHLRLHQKDNRKRPRREQRNRRISSKNYDIQFAGNYDMVESEDDLMALSIELSCTPKKVIQDCKNENKQKN